MSSATLSPTTIRINQKPLRIIFGVLLFPLLLLFAAVLWFYFTARASLPQLNGSLRVAGISAPVEVIRDSQGVPHIRAGNMRDLLFAQGYVIAQDRLWQLDISRRYASGEMAEILGPDWIQHDRQQRILSLRQVAERSAATLNFNEKELFSAYVLGVNNFIESHGKHLPIEFHLLGYTPRPWTIEDSFLVGANMAQMLNHDQFAIKLSREKVTSKLGAQLAADLYPNRSWRDRPPGLQKNQQNQITGTGKNGSDQESDSKVADLRFSPSSFLIPLSKDIEPETKNEERGTILPGSNNWVVSGAHSVTGKPLLSNDMHLRHQIPNVWYEAHLSAGDFDVAGLTLPGIPYVIAGHNRRIAWGYTNLGPDVEDIFIETFNRSGQYQTAQGWEQPKQREEVIHVKKKPDVHIKILTTRHGPIATELMSGETRTIALQWTLYDTGFGMPFADLNAAGNWKQFRDAFRRYTAPALNVVYADVDGNIGYQAAGDIPRRVSGDGSLPVPGNDGNHEWTGYVPFDQLPSIYNPPSGTLATANGRITPDHYPYSLSTQWGPPYRTERIYHVLESGKQFSSDDMLALQNDIYSALDLLCAGEFADAVDRSQHASARVKEAASLLRSWDGRLTADSAAATIEITARTKLMQRILQPRLGSLWEDYAWYNWPVALENILTYQPKAWLPSEFTTYDGLLAAAVEDAVHDSQSPWRLSSWHRGKQFPLVIQHPILGKIPFISHWSGPGMVAQTGGSWTVKQVGRSFGPSERMTVDLANLDDSTLNIVTGQSGQIFSPYCMNQWHA